MYQKIMGNLHKFLNEITCLDRSVFSISIGLRASIFVMTPLIIGIATGHKEFTFATMGAMFLINTEGPKGATLSVRILLVACFTEAIALGLGTLVGTTGFLAIPLVGIGVFTVLMVESSPRLTQVGIFTAIIFAVGVGLPGGSTSVAIERLWLSLLGGLLALLGVMLHRFLISRKTSGGTDSTSESSRIEQIHNPVYAHQRIPLLQSEALRHAIAVGAASAFGLAIGLVLGFPRDFWVVVTIIASVRPNIGSTISFTSMRVIGTVVGAVIAAAITLEISNLYLLAGLLFAFSIFMFATRGVNPVLVQVFLVPFVIILINVIYPGQWQLAEIRIVDVVIGGAIVVLTVYLLGIRTVMHNFWKK
jgi:hypothetical protein